MSIKNINTMLKDQMKKIMVESEISEPSHIAKMIIGDVSHQTGILVRNVTTFGNNNGASGTFGINELGSDGKQRSKGVQLNVTVEDESISVDVTDMSANILNSFSGLRDMQDYSSLIDTISRSIQSFGISK